MLVGLCGFEGCGKNTAASALLAHHPGQMLAFAGALKSATATIFQWDRGLLEGDTPASRAWREQADPVWSARLGRSIVPREILQLLGTEVVRTLHPDIWVHALAVQYQSTDPQTVSVVTDARFGNELAWVREERGALFWIYREDTLWTHRLPDAMFRFAAPLTTADFAHLRHAGHRSSMSFLTEGADHLHVLIENTQTPEMLERLVLHAYDVARDPQHCGLPWGKQTLYLRSATDVMSSHAYEMEWRCADPTTHGSVQTWNFSPSGVCLGRDRQRVV